MKSDVSWKPVNGYEDIKLEESAYLEKRKPDYKKFKRLP